MKIFAHLSKPGLVCAAGKNSDELWHNLAGYRNTFFRQVQFSPERTLWAGIVEDEDVNLSENRSHFYNLQNSALDQIKDEIEEVVSRFGCERVAVCTGACDNGSEFSVSKYSDGTFAQDFRLEMQSPYVSAKLVKDRFGLKGPCVTVNTACSSSAQVFIRGAQLLKSGLADAVIAGGADITSGSVALGFDSLKSVSSEPTDPFSGNRKGLTLGEAAVYFVMTKEKLERSEMDFVLSGYGESCDAYHMTSPDPEGKGAIKAMELALDKAEIPPEAVDYLNLHGTGTKFNDSMEAVAVNSVFADYRVPASSTKAVTGHTLGAAGALEAAVCYETLLKQENYAPHIWDGVQDPGMPVLNLVDRNDCKTGKPLKYCMSNSFAFGGSNVSLIFGKN